MTGIHNYASFIAAILIFQAIPGAGTIAILNATARNGRRAGMAAVAGTLLGDLVYMSAAVAGLAAVLQANPLILRAIQYGGAAYLCWLGLQLLRARLSAGTGAAEPQRPASLYFRQALVVALTNPKVILFFVSFFPLFLSADASPTTLLTMVLHVSLISLLWQTVLVTLGNAVAFRLRALPSARRLATRLAGLALLAFGLRLAADHL